MGGNQSTFSDFFKILNTVFEYQILNFLAHCGIVQSDLCSLSCQMLKEESTEKICPQHKMSSIIRAFLKN